MKRRHRARGKRPARIVDLPLIPLTWEIDVLDLAAPAEPETVDAAGELVLLALEVESESVTCAEAVRAGDWSEVTRSVLRAMQAPRSGPPRRPQLILVRDPQLEAALRAVLAHDQTVEVREELPRIRQFHEELMRSRGGAAQTYLEYPDLTPAGVTTFFDAAAAFYEAAPWTVLDDDQPISLELPGHARPLYAVILGGSGMTYGLALYFDAEMLVATYERDEDEVPQPGENLAVTFVPEADAGTRAAEERRQQRWRIAGPAAYPLLMRTDEHGDLIDPAPDDLRTITRALNAVERFVRENRAQLERSEPLTADVPEDDTGARCRLRYPAHLERSPGANLDLFADSGPDAAGGAPPPSAEAAGSAFVETVELLRDLSARMARLRVTDGLLARLAWSFFRDSEPLYLDGHEQQSDARTRFYDWSCFLAPVAAGGRTLAHIALDAANDLADAARAERAALLPAVYGMGPIASVRRGQGHSFTDVFTGQLYHVRQPLGTTGMRVGNWFFGALVAMANGDHVPAGGALSMRLKRAQIDELMELRDMEPRQRPLAVEALLFGASTDWIQELTEDELPEEYGRFRADLRGVGIPSLSRLRKRVRAADQPSSLFAEVSQLTWANPDEVGVFAAFLQRVWNTTPRKELDELTPEQAYRADPS